MAGSSLRSVLGLSLAGLAIVTVVVLLRTFTLDNRTIEGPACTPLDTDFIHGDEALLARFQDAIRLDTISRARGDFNPDKILMLHQHIQNSYKILHSSPLVTREVIANYSLLYTVKGSDPSLTPFMLTGHMDVVPVTEGHWEAPPFSADIVDGYVYGRGTIDDKHTVFGILEAVEFLLSRGHKPRRTFYLGFGHDEEVGGKDGAYNIAQTLLRRGVQLEFLIDEGMTIVNGAIPGISVPVALVGSSEKGRVTIKLTATAKGGHSSMPLKESSIGVLAKAVTRLEENPHPSMFGTGPERGTFEHLAPQMSFPMRVVMSNLWLFSPLVSRFLSRKPETNAVVRTTTAVTMFHAGVKENVIATTAEAIVNHRIHPTQSVQEVIDYDKKIIGDDRVEMTIVNRMEPLPLSPYGDEHFGWQTIKTSILQVWGKTGVVVAPTLETGNTDTRHYTELTRQLYRFSPTFMFLDDITRFHGLNERIAVGNYQDAVNFFYHVLVNADRDGLALTHTHADDL